MLVCAWVSLCRVFGCGCMCAWGPVHLCHGLCLILYLICIQCYYACVQGCVCVCLSVHVCVLKRECEYICVFFLLCVWKKWKVCILFYSKTEAICVHCHCTSVCAYVCVCARTCTHVCMFGPLCETCNGCTVMTQHFLFYELWTFTARYCRDQNFYFLMSEWAYIT